MNDKEEPASEPVESELVDEVVGRLLDRSDASGVALLGEGGLLTQVTRAVLERALKAEMTGHLGYERHDPGGRGSGNSRNGTSPKTVLTDAGEVGTRRYAGSAGRWTARTRLPGGIADYKIFPPAPRSSPRPAAS